MGFFSSCTNTLISSQDIWQDRKTDAGYWHLHSSHSWPQKNLTEKHDPFLCCAIVWMLPFVIPTLLSFDINIVKIHVLAPETRWRVCITLHQWRSRTRTFFYRTYGCSRPLWFSLQGKTPRIPTFRREKTEFASVSLEVICTWQCPNS